MLHINIPHQQGGKGSAGSDIDEMVAQESMRMGNELEGNNPPATDPFGMEPGGVQTASAYGKFVGSMKKGLQAVDQGIGRLTGGVTDPRTQDALSRVRDRQQQNNLDEETVDMVSGSLDAAAESPPALEAGGAEATQTKQGGIEAVDVDPADVQRRYEEGTDPLEKRTDMRNVNIERHMEESETSDDVAQMFEAVAESISDKHVVRSNKSLEEMTPEDIKAELKDFLGKNAEERGLMSDRKLYAARQILNTMGMEVADMANQIKAGDATPEVLLTYQKKVKALGAFQQFLRGNVRKVAQALQQQSIIAKTLKVGNLGDIDELMNVASMTPMQIQRHAQVMAARIENDGPIAAMSPKFTERMNNGFAVATEYWKANLLSGPATHIVNMAGNGAYNAWENLVIRPTAAGFGAARSAISKDPITDKVYISETMSALVGSYAGIRDGVTVMLNTLINDKSAFLTMGKGESMGRMNQLADGVGPPGEFKDRNLAGKAAHVTSRTLSMPFRLLQAEDDLFKTVAYRQELTALSDRTARGEGHEGKALTDRVAELVEEPTDTIHEAAMLYAKNLTFTNTAPGGMIGMIGQSVKKWTAAMPVLAHIAPFINTPVNLVNRAVDVSVLAIANKELREQWAKGGAARDTANAKIATGGALTAMTYFYFANGQLTGNGPKNPEQRRAIEKTGVQFNSFRDMDGNYHSYKRMEPFATAIAPLVDMLEASQYALEEPDAAAYAGAAVFGMAKHVNDATFMRGIGDAFKLMDGKISAANYFASVSSGYIPLASAGRTVSKLVDPQPRRGTDDKMFQTGFVNSFANQLNRVIPGMSLSQRPARHWDGSVAVVDQGRVAYAMSPFKYRKFKGATPADVEMIESGLGAAEPTPMITLGRGPTAITVSIMDMDKGAGMLYDAYFVQVGKARKEIIAKTIKKSSYKKLSQGPGGERRGSLQKALHMARKKGLKEFLKELKQMDLDDPEKFNDFAAAVGQNPSRFRRAMLDTLKTRDLLGEEAMLPEDVEQLEHVRKGRGKLETPLPVPTDKPFEVGF